MVGRDWTKAVSRGLWVVAVILVLVLGYRRARTVHQQQSDRAAYERSHPRCCAVFRALWSSPHARFVLLRATAAQVTAVLGEPMGGQAIPAAHGRRPGSAAAGDSERTTLYYWCPEAQWRLTLSRGRAVAWAREPSATGPAEEQARQDRCRATLRTLLKNEAARRGMIGRTTEDVIRTLGLPNGDSPRPGVKIGVDWLHYSCPDVSCIFRFTGGRVAECSAESNGADERRVSIGTPGWPDAPQRRLLARPQFFGFSAGPSGAPRPRGGPALWVRGRGTPAVLVRSPADR
jgi:hypothetical protein